MRESEIAFLNIDASWQFLLTPVSVLHAITSPILLLHSEANCHSVSLIKIQSNCSKSGANALRPVISLLHRRATEQKAVREAFPEWIIQKHGVTSNRTGFNDRGRSLKPRDTCIENKGVGFTAEYRPLSSTQAQVSVKRKPSTTPAIVASNDSQHLICPPPWDCTDAETNCAKAHLIVQPINYVQSFHTNNPKVVGVKSRTASLMNWSLFLPINILCN